MPLASEQGEKVGTSHSSVILVVQPERERERERKGNPAECLMEVGHPPDQRSESRGETSSQL